MSTHAAKTTSEDPRTVYQRAQEEVTRLCTRRGEVQAELAEATRQRAAILRDVAAGGDKARLTKVRPRIAELEELLDGIGTLIGEAESRAAEAHGPVLAVEAREHESAVAEQTAKVKAAWEQMIQGYVATAMARGALVLEFARLDVIDHPAASGLRVECAPKRKFPEQAVADAVTVGVGFNGDLFEFFLPPLAPPLPGVPAGSECPARAYLAARDAAVTA